ncbi:MAG: TolC family outer membrane protein [Caulobacteraceae bacterium]|nr:TolC family outer membrane protein [Caulobacteraceae bacterium]
MRAETLYDAINLAYQSNPTLQSQRAQLRALNENYVQARAGFRPQASASSEFDYTKSPTLFGNEVETASATLSVSQPIFTGGAVSSQVRAAMANILSGRQKLRQAESQVLGSVIQAYVDVRRDQAALRITQDNVGVLTRQLEETRARFEVGQITRTDVAQSEARLAQAQAQLSSAMSQLSVSRAAYVSVVGQNPGDLAPAPPLAGLPTTIDEAFTTAEKNNPGILAADLAEQAAEAQIAEAKAANRPNVSLRASLGTDGVVRDAHYRLYPQREDTYRKSVTASAVFTQPLFTGGMNASRIRQALENDNTQRLALENARRGAVQNVAQYWSQLLSARASAVSNQKQVDADEIAFEGTRQEAQVGLRTTLDVLNAEQELHAAQLALVNARHDEYVATAGVLSAMGLLEARNITPGATLYSPEKAFNKVKGSGGAPWDMVVSTVDGLGAPRIRKAPQAPPATRPTSPAMDAPAVAAQAGSPVLQ